MAMFWVMNIGGTKSNGVNVSIDGGGSTLIPILESGESQKIILEQGKGSKATAYLTVIPPKDIGYNYGQGTVKVTMTPYRAENNEEVGNPSYATFIVQSRGFSSSGIENIFLIFIFIVIAIVVIFIIVRKKLY